MGNLRTLRILIVDHSEGYAVLEDGIEGIDARVMLTRTVSETIAYNEVTPDLKIAIVALRPMEGVDGLAVCRGIRERNPDTRIIIYTLERSLGQLYAAARLADVVLQKGIDNLEAWLQHFADPDRFSRPINSPCWRVVLPPQG